MGQYKVISQPREEGKPQLYSVVNSVTNEVMFDDRELKDARIAAAELNSGSHAWFRKH